MKSARNLLPELYKQESYQPANWTSRHRYCIALEMAGLKNSEIAIMMGWSESKVSITLCDNRAAAERTQFAGRVAEKITDVHMKLELLSSEALDEAVDIMRNSTQGGLRLKSAFGILDRAGYTSTPREVAAATSIPSETLDQMGEVLKEIKAHSNSYETPAPIVDAEFEVVESDG